MRKVFSAQCTVHIQGKQGQRGLMGEIYSRAEEALLLQHKTGKSRALLIRSTEGTEGGREKPSKSKSLQILANMRRRMGEGGRPKCGGSKQTAPSV